MIHRLAALETKKESDCITKYIFDQYDDDGSVQYAIGNNILIKLGKEFKYHCIIRTEDVR